MSKRRLTKSTCFARFELTVDDTLGGMLPQAKQRGTVTQGVAAY
jgi:hypothetical protein